MNFTVDCGGGGHARIKRRVLSMHNGLNCMTYDFSASEVGCAQFASGIFMSTSPPFRADHVGSLLRPKFLLDARAAAAKGDITATQLREVEDRAIDNAIRLQEDVGL